MGTPSPTVMPSPSAVDCTMVPTTEILARSPSKVTFPTTGRFVVESHLRTKDEVYSGRDGFPKNATEGIIQHLRLHDGVLAPLGRRASDVYKEDYEKEFTPKEEGGEWGQGSEEILPTIEQETWIANLPWKAERPSMTKPEKWLIKNGTQMSVVVVLGFESGPTFDMDYLGGAQPAIHFFLKATDETPLTIGKLRDQSIPLGVAKCL